MSVFGFVVSIIIFLITGQLRINSRQEFAPFPPEGGGGESTTYNGLYGEALGMGETPPVRGIFFRLLVYERVGVLPLKLYERVRKSVISVCERT